MVRLTGGPSFGGRFDRAGNGLSKKCTPAAWSGYLHDLVCSAEYMVQRRLHFVAASASRSSAHGVSQLMFSP